MADIEAIRLLTKDLQSLKTLPNPPSSYDGIDTFNKTITEVIEHALDTTQNVATYGEAIDAKMNEMHSALNQSMKKIQHQIKKAIDSVAVVTTGKPPSKIMEYVHMLQKVEQKQQRLEELVVKTQLIMEKVQQGVGVTNSDIKLLRGCLGSWMEEKEESYQEEQDRLANEENEREEEKRKLKEEEQRKREEDEERKRKDEEDRKNKEEEERLKREREERRRKEEEKKKMEEMERKRSEEEERKKREAKKKEEEERRRKDPANWTPHT